MKRVQSENGFALSSSQEMAELGFLLKIVLNHFSKCVCLGWW